MPWKHWAATLEAEGKRPEAETMRRQVVAGWRNNAGDDAPNTVSALAQLALLLEREGKWPEAETVRGEVLAEWRKRSGNADPQTLYALRQSGYRRSKAKANGRKRNPFGASRWSYGANAGK